MLDINNLLKSVNVEPREYQKRIVTKIYELFTEKNLRSVLIDSPVGSGKTIMALLVAKAMHELLGIKIGWIAMRRFLLKQAKEENIEKGFNVPLTFLSMFDKNPPTDLQMLIVDEAQHDATDSMAHMHSVIAPKYLLGMSGTSWRSDRVKLCFDTVVKDAGIPVLINNGFLSPYHHYTIPKWGVQEVVDMYVNDVERWGTSIMYFHRLANCYQANDLLLRNGIKSEVVDGASSAEDQIERFIAGDLDVLVNCMKLTEGLNVCKLKTVFVRPSCKGVTIQMAGRVLRKYPPIQFKQIVQSEDTPYPFTKLAMAQLQHVLIEGEWRTLQVNKHIDDINKKTILALSRIETDLPEFIKKGQKKLIWRGSDDNNIRQIQNQVDNLITREAIAINQ